MIVYDFDLTGISTIPFENNSPLIIDPYRIKTLPISGQFFQPIGRRNAKIGYILRAIEHP